MAKLAQGTTVRIGDCPIRLSIRKLEWGGEVAVFASGGEKGRFLQEDPNYRINIRSDV